MYFAYNSNFLKVPSHESYMQRHAQACLHREEMPPFLLALGFNAVIPPRSRVQLIAASLCKHAPERQTGQGIGRGAATMRSSLVVKR